MNEPNLTENKRASCYAKSPTVQDIDWGFTGSTNEEDDMFYITRSQVAYVIYMIGS